MKSSILYKKLFFTFLSNFLIQYFIFTSLVLNSILDFTHNMSKLYISIIVGLVMVLFEIILLLYKNFNKLNITLFIATLVCFIFFTFLYRNQYGIDQLALTKYLKESNSAHRLIFAAHDLL